MQDASLRTPSNLDKIPVSRRYVATGGMCSCPCLAHFPTFPMPWSYKSIPDFGSVIQPSAKSTVNIDFRLGYSGFYPVCSWKLPRMETTQLLWAACSTAWLSSWWKGLSKYLIWTSLNCDLLLSLILLLSTAVKRLYSFCIWCLQQSEDFSLQSTFLIS